MALERVPPPPEGGGPDQFQAPPPPPWKWLAIVLVLVGVVGGLWLASHSEEAPVAATTPTPPPPPGPSIQLQPSLAVPGPAYVPHPAEDNGNARPDEAIMFRLSVREKGYILLAVEGEDGKLYRIRGGRPDEEPLEGSHLLFEDGQILAYALEPHKGKKVTFVAALSKKPWDPFPTSLPSSPRTWPDPTGAEVPPPADPILAWDRFTLNVLTEVPPPAPPQ